METYTSGKLYKIDPAGFNGYKYKLWEYIEPDQSSPLRELIPNEIVVYLYRTHKDSSFSFVLTQDGYKGIITNHILILI